MRLADARAGGVSLPEMMLGEKAGDLYPDRHPEPGEVLLEARGLSLAGAFSDVHLAARRGEILGLFGLVGSGIDELSKALFGILHPDAGEIAIHGKTVRLRSAQDALTAGIFLVPGDRRTEGLTMTRDVCFNMTLANLKRASGVGWLVRTAAERREGADLANRVALQPPTLSRNAGQFSGGNQQKIVIAKGLYAEAEIYIFAEPTVGVDIGARAKLYALMRELSRTKAVIVMSSDADEVYGIADRVVALYKGRAVYEADASASTRGQLLEAGIMSTSAAPVHGSAVA